MYKAGRDFPDRRAERRALRRVIWCTTDEESRTRLCHAQGLLRKPDKLRRTAGSLCHKQSTTVGGQCTPCHYTTARYISVELGMTNQSQTFSSGNPPIRSFEDWSRRGQQPVSAATPLGVCSILPTSCFGVLQDQRCECGAERIHPHKDGDDVWRTCVCGVWVMEWHTPNGLSFLFLESSLTTLVVRPSPFRMLSNQN